MSTAPDFHPISVDEYLDGELVSQIKHEFVDGRVYLMAGARNVHNRIATRALVAISNQLEGSPCETFNSDTKVRIRQKHRTYFYYPDATVICQPNPESDTFQDQPSVIVEVVSESTRRVDEGEKRENYLSLDSLDTYVLIEQDRRGARVFQRAEDSEFRESLYSEHESEIPLPSINAKLRFADLYRGIEFIESEEALR